MWDFELQFWDGSRFDFACPFMLHLDVAAFLGLFIQAPAHLGKIRLETPSLGDLSSALKHLSDFASFEVVADHCVLIFTRFKE
jgi:hypothetical protein